jgi:hypothetical protein
VTQLRENIMNNVECSVNTLVRGIMYNSVDILVYNAVDRFVEDAVHHLVEDLVYGLVNHSIKRKYNE